MIRVWSLTKYIIFCFVLSQLYAFSQFSGGSGTESDPYQITSKADMETLASLTNAGTGYSTGKYFKLMNDITDSITTIIGWYPAIIYAPPTIMPDISKCFNGNFDGNCRTINIAITAASNNGGTFGVNYGIIQNLTVNGHLSWLAYSQNGAGAVVGLNLGTVKYCTNNANFSYSTSSPTAGIVGINASLVDHCVNNANLTSSFCALSGIVSNNYGGTISYCTNNGNLTTTNGANVGGIALFSLDSNSTISNCINTGTITSNGNRIGGITSRIDGDVLDADNCSVIINCLAVGYFDGSGANYRGYMTADYDIDAQIINCFYDINSFPSGWYIDDGLVTGLSTSDMQGTALQSILGDGWAYADGEYPRIIYDMCDTFSVITQPDNAVNGSTTPANTMIIEKNSVVITATAAACYRFVKWTNIAGDSISNKAIDTIVVFSDTTLIAVFQKDTFHLQAWIEPPTAGILTGTGFYECGTEAILNIELDDDCYHFESWIHIINSDVFSTQNPDTILMNKYITIVAFLVRDSFTLTLRANPVNTGTTTGSGLYACGGDSAVVTAIPAACYHFVNWTDSVTKAEVSRKQIDTVLITENRTLIANFQRDSFTLSLRVNPEGSGVAYGSGLYACGFPVSVSTNANECLYFTCWTNASGDTVSNISNEVFTIYSDSVLTANFSRYTLVVNLVADPTVGGTVNGADTWYNQYFCGDTVDIVALPFTDYSFINWTLEDGSVYSTNSTDKIVIIRDIVLMGHFVKNVGAEDTLRLTLTTNPANAGITTGAGYYSENDTVTITATAMACYHFANWTDGNGNVISTDATTKIIIIKDSALTANFVRDSFNISLQIVPSDAGSVTGSGRYGCGSQNVIIATANDCFQFVCWTDEAGDTVSKNITATITLNRDTTLTANFATDPFTLTLIADQPSPNGGSVYGAGDYDCEAEVTIRAVADVDYTFLYWIEDGVNVSTDTAYTLIMKKHRTLTAKFISNAVVLRTLTLISNPSNAGTAKGGGKYEDSTEVEISATITDACYHFVNWTDKYNNIISEKIIDTIFIIGDTTLTANFAKDTFDLTTTPNPADGGTATGTGRYACGEAAIITAIANANYLFVNWSEAETGEVVSMQEIDTIIMDNHRNLIANFAEIPGEPDTTLIVSIRASEHTLVDPRTQNYGLPIYITLNESISELVIESLKILINVNVFYPRASSSGVFSAQLSGDVFEITLEDIRVTNLPVSNEVILFNIFGDIMLGDTDSSGILLSDVVFSSDLVIKELGLVDGYITTGICVEGGDRLLEIGEKPGIFVDENPVSELLKVTCKTLERGNYSLEVVDLLGNSTKIKTFAVTQATQNNFNFEIPIEEFGDGTYIIIMHAPNAKYTNKFVVIKQ